MKKHISLFVLLAVMVTAFRANAQNYSSILKDVIRKNLGNVLKGYQVFDYPTDNFGLITTYKKNTKDENFECDMFTCVGIDKKTSTDAQWLDVGGYSANGAGASIVLDQDVQNKLGADILLPKIFSILGLTANYDSKKITNLKLTLGPVVMRKLNKFKMGQYLNSLPSASPQRQLFNSGQMVIVVADCVITTMDVEITVNDTSAMGLDAHFGWKGNTVASKILDSASVGFNISKQAAGTYKFTMSHPIIFARLASKQPGGGSLADVKTGNFDDWAIMDEEQLINTAHLEKAKEKKALKQH